MNSRVMVHVVAAMVLISCSAGAVYAAEQPLSLKDAEDIAIKNHPRISAADLNALASEQEVRQNRSAYFPVVTANATAVGTASDNTRIAAGGLNNPLILERNAEGISVSQIITDFGRTANLTAGSKLHSRAEEEKALATRADIVLQVESAYFSALQAQSVLGVANQTVATRQLILDQVSELATNQLKSGLDVSFARVSLEEGKLLLASAQNDVQAALARLANLLGEREQKDYQLQDEPVPTAPSPDDSQYMQTALTDRPDLAQLRYERDAAAKFANAEKALHYPTISAVGAAGVVPIHDPLLPDSYAAAGVNLSFPIFSGFLFSARATEAKLKAKAADEDLRDAEDEVLRDVRVAVLNENLAAERLSLTAQLLDSANQAFDLAQARYKAGLNGIVELSQAQLSKTQAEIEQARAKYEFQTRNAILDFETGRNLQK